MEKRTNVNSHLISRKADMVIKEEPSTRKASHPFAASMAASALALGTLSPKKTTCNCSRSMTILIYYCWYPKKNCLHQVSELLGTSDNQECRNPPPRISHRSQYPHQAFASFQSSCLIDCHSPSFQ